MCRPRSARRIFPLLLALYALPLNAENLLLNPGFEQTTDNGQLPVHWMTESSQAQPLELTDEAYEGERAALFIGDGQLRMWRQNVEDLKPELRRWQLTAKVKADDVVYGKGDYVQLYGHIIYKDQPYSTATHFHAQAKPGTYDWREILKFPVEAAATPGFEVEKIHVSLVGKFRQGKLLIDDVRLIPVDPELSATAKLKRKIHDLQSQLDRVGTIDSSVDEAQTWLKQSLEALGQSPPDVGTATSHWHSAAKMISHEVWKAMYPEAMADDDVVEAQMIYHGMGPNEEVTKFYLDKIELTGANAVYLSFGSWMYVNYHSDILPVETDWQEFDALTYFIEEAHKRGLKVFGYLAPFYGTHSPTVLPGSIYEKHPEWFARGPDNTMPTFPDPANPEVVDFMVSAYEELVTRYKLDGIGLDYIRYPTPESFNYSEENRQQIHELYGVDILKHENLMGDSEAWSKVQEFRRNAIGKVIRRVADAVREARPDIAIMACLISEREWAREDFGQDWEASSKLLDYASPMNYDDRSLDLEMLEDQKKVFEKSGAIWIPALGGMGDVHESWTISDWAERVAIQRTFNPGGIIIYRISEFDPAVAAFFGKGPFHAAASFPAPPER